MPLDPSWTDIALRLVLTIVASAVIGLNRGSRGHAAGLRTTILVGLAAAVAMVQMNLLLPVDGKTPQSFSVMDIMRLPLGILTGVGFIGGGTILKRGDLVTGVTTAATLWVVTVIGLCFGGGQIALGLAATAASVLTLWPLTQVDARLPRQHRAMLGISGGENAGTPPDIQRLLAPLGYRVEFRKRIGAEHGKRIFWFEVMWRRPDFAGAPADLLKALDDVYDVETFQITSEARH
jgi:putative Mg2+ transporter-C (MgtC) family protein